MQVGMAYCTPSFLLSRFTAVLLTLSTSTHTLSLMVKFSNVDNKQFVPCSLLGTQQVYLPVNIEGTGDHISLVEVGHMQVT